MNPVTIVSQGNIPTRLLSHPCPPLHKPASLRLCFVPHKPTPPQFPRSFTPRHQLNPQPQLPATMPRLATALVLAVLSLVLAPLSMAGPIPQTMSSSSAVYTDVPPVESPTIAFTLGEHQFPPLLSLEEDCDPCADFLRRIRRPR